MNAPYPAPPPGPAYPPGYPPPPRRGMGCFAKGCLVTLLVFFVLGILAGLGGWFIYKNVRPFVSTAPVGVRVSPATAEQFAELQARIQTFQTALADGHSATLELSADDLNTFVARNPSYRETRGILYLGTEGNQLVVDASVPVSGAKRRAGGTGTTYYFNGRLFCDFSFAGGDFTVAVRKVETLDGQPMSPFIAGIVANPDFSRSLSRSFNDGLHDSLQRNPAGEEFMGKVRTITVQNNRVVIVAGD